MTALNAGFASTSCKPRSAPCGHVPQTPSNSAITIKAGPTITWTNNDDRDHAVVAHDGSFKSWNISAGMRAPEAGGRDAIALGAGVPVSVTERQGKEARAQRRNDATGG